MPPAPPVAKQATPLLASRAVSFIKHHRRIVDRVSLAVGAGEVLTIIGPNGAGKTTLLKLLLGITPPSEGRVVRRRGVRVGYMPQRFQPPPQLPLTVGRFLALTAQHRVWQHWTSKIHRTFNGSDGEGDNGNHGTGAWRDEIISMNRLGGLLDASLHTLSGGEMQRVLLAAALIHRPHMLVLDEPAQNLDLGGRVAFYRLLESLHKTHGMSIVMVSHDLHMVMASTQRVVCLYGHICCSGAPQAVAQDPEFLRLFGGRLTDTMAVYHHDHTHDHDHA